MEGRKYLIPGGIKFIGKSRRVGSGLGDKHEGVQNFHGAARRRLEGPPTDLVEDGVHERAVGEGPVGRFGALDLPGGIDAEPDE